MQHSVMQSSVGVKPIVVEGLPWSWGFECALRGGSVYDGYQYFCNRQFLQFERGYFAGLALAQRIEAKVRVEVRRELHGAPADFAEGVADVELGAHYCSAGVDWAAVEDERIGD